MPTARGKRFTIFDMMDEKGAVLRPGGVPEDAVLTEG
jgi:hypothetical protein